MTCQLNETPQLMVVAFINPKDQRELLHDVILIKNHEGLTTLGTENGMIMITATRRILNITLDK